MSSRYGLISAASMFLAMLVSVLTVPVASAHDEDLNFTTIEIFLRAEGYDLTRISDETLRLKTSNYVVLIVVKGKDGDISYISFLDGYDLTKQNYEILNRFNHKNKFGRAYFDKDKDLVLQMDRNVAGGMTQENILSDMNVFLSLLKQLSKVYQGELGR